MATASTQPLILCTDIKKDTEYHFYDLIDGITKKTPDYILEKTHIHVGTEADKSIFCSSDLKTILDKIIDHLTERYRGYSGATMLEDYEQDDFDFLDATLFPKTFSLDVHFESNEQGYFSFMIYNLKSSADSQLIISYFKDKFPALEIETK